MTRHATPRDATFRPAPSTVHCVCHLTHNKPPSLPGMQPYTCGIYLCGLHLPCANGVERRAVEATQPQQSGLWHRRRLFVRFGSMGRCTKSTAAPLSMTGARALAGTERAACQECREHTLEHSHNHTSTHPHTRTHRFQSANTRKSIHYGLELIYR